MSAKAVTQDEKLQTLEKEIDTKADLKDIQYIKETLTEIKGDLKKHMDSD